MKIFITGASGFVGGATVARLVKAGHEVLAMSRSERSDPTICGLGAKPVRCDLETINESHLRGCDVVIHAAAHADVWGPDGLFDRVNVDGTENMLRAARNGGVSRFIHISSDSALVNGQSLNNIDETYPLAVNSPYDYCRTKALSERAVLQANDEENNFITLALRPRLVWGDGGSHLLTMVVEMARKGKWKWINEGRAVTSTTYIENLVDAIELSLTKGRPGQAYFIVDEGVVSTREMIIAMAATKGISLPDDSISKAFAMVIGSVFEFVWTFLKLKNSPPITRTGVVLSTIDAIVCGDLAKRDLNFTPRVSVAEGLEFMRNSNT